MSPKKGFSASPNLFQTRACVLCSRCRTWPQLPFLIPRAALGNDSRQCPFLFVKKYKEATLFVGSLPQLPAQTNPPPFPQPTAAFFFPGDARGASLGFGRRRSATVGFEVCWGRWRASACARGSCPTAPSRWLPLRCAWRSLARTEQQDNKQKDGQRWVWRPGRLARVANSPCWKIVVPFKLPQVRPCAQRATPSSGWNWGQTIF